MRASWRKTNPGGAEGVTLLETPTFKKIKSLWVLFQSLQIVGHRLLEVEADTFAGLLFHFRIEPSLVLTSDHTYSAQSLHPAVSASSLGLFVIRFKQALYRFDIDTIPDVAHTAAAIHFFT